MHRQMTDLLNVWGAGQLLAFSGIDGPTDYQHGLVARTAELGCGLRVKLPAQCLLEFSDTAPTATFLAGDCFGVTTTSGQVRGAFLDAHHLLIEGTCRMDACDSSLAVLQRDGKTLLAPADLLQPEKIGADLDAAIDARLAWLIKQATHAAGPSRRTLTKALSIMKSQVCTPEGLIQHRWTTPDRWPHRGMWLWDSAFHAIGWRHIDPALAQDMLLAVLDGQREDGLIAIRTNPSGRTGDDMTQPPVLALAADLVLEKSGDQTLIEQMYEPLTRYIHWDLANRDSDGGGLVEWFIEENRNCRCGESGWDNSPRFDCALSLDAVDFNTFLAAECEVLQRWAQRLSREEEARQWQAQHQRMCDLINQRLWDDDAGLYVDCIAATGQKQEIWSAAGLLPLLCGAPSAQQAKRLAEHLENPRTFGTAVPIPTIAACQEQYYQKDMWRGPVWININWLIARGLDRYGLTDQADALRLRTIQEIERWYEQCGSIYEFYDDRGRMPPPDMPRKGKNAPEVNPLHQVIHDYGWSATLYVDLIRSQKA